MLVRGRSTANSTRVVIYEHPKFASAAERLRRPTVDR
jgi:hypothetical protein